MPSVDENLSHWSSYDWSQEGDEWSEVWGDSRSLWFGTILPRIRDAVANVESILEIAPGYGRVTQFLKHHCRRLVVVDLTERCIEACRKRFKDDDHIEFHVNDGYTLPMVEDHSIDFVFSFDSLVHVEADVVISYLRESSRVMRPGGLGFLHHSNLGAFVDAETQRLSIENPHWRAASVSANLFRETCEQTGLKCVSQEIVNWGRQNLTDCLSLFTPAGSRFERPLQVVENPRFMEEALYLGRLSALYSLAP